MRRHLTSDCWVVLLQVLSPFIYHATQKLLAESYKNDKEPLPIRMRKKSGLYQAGICAASLQLPTPCNPAGYFSTPHATRAPELLHTGAWL